MSLPSAQRGEGGCHIHVVTPVVPTGLTKQSDFDGILPAPDYVTFTELKAGPTSVESAVDAAQAAPGVVERVMEAQATDAAAIVIDCMAEPGLGAAREVSSVPVLGPCSTAMGIAAGLGCRFSLLTVSSGMDPIFEGKARQLVRFPLRCCTVSCRSLVRNPEPRH